MFNLDDTFLDEVGLGAMPAELRKPFLQHVYEQLEQRVGIRLSEGMSDAQLEEFESIIDRKDEIIAPWLAAHAPQYATEDLFLKLKQTSGLPTESAELRAEYAATKWLEVNRPDYRDVVAKTLGELKIEISENKDALLGNA